MDVLEDKVAVVTGGAAGLGLGMATAFAEEGMRVVLADIYEERVARAASCLSRAGHEAVGVATDVADAAAVARLRDAAFERFGAVHVLCDNAGIGLRGLVTEPIDTGAWCRVFDVDFFAILDALNGFLPGMLEQGEGHIVNTSSRQGLIAAPDRVSFSAAAVPVPAWQVRRWARGRWSVVGGLWERAAIGV
jgi:NADP-dependent 3-hydroxy acid dehydrogenase YdfG